MDYNRCHSIGSSEVCHGMGVLLHRGDALLVTDQLDGFADESGRSLLIGNEYGGIAVGEGACIGRLMVFGCCG